MKFDWTNLREPRELPVDVVIRAHLSGIAFASALVIGLTLVLASVMKVVMG